MDIMATLRKPAVWMILFASLHTLGFSLDVVSAVTDDDEISTYLENEIDPEIADNQKLIDTVQEENLFSWGFAMMWSVVLFGGAFWLKGSEQAKLSLSFGSGMIGFGLIMGYSGVMFYDGYDFEVLMGSVIFGTPMIVTGYLNLEE